MVYQLSKLADLMQGKLIGEDLTIHGVSIDSRQDNHHKLFIAIRGENFDGHEFIEAAYDSGAGAVISEQTISTKKPYIIVSNTRHALGLWGRFHRSHYTNPVIGLTGSMGKTTTKAFLRSIFAQQGTVLAPSGSMNNDIGVPLTLLALDQQDTAIIEMGTNHFGEIAYLSQLVQPDTALITLIAGAHLETLKDLDGVVRAKSEIFQGLTAEGYAVLNADDPSTQKLLATNNLAHCVFFGTHPTAQVRATSIKVVDSGCVTFTLHYLQQQIAVQLALPGEHQLTNALAAAAVASVYEIPIFDVKQGLETTQAEKSRLVFLNGKQGSRIIDDSYSAIPEAVTAALKVLAKSPGQKIFVFADMGELNPELAIEAHKKVGLLARQYGVNQLLSVGPLAKQHTMPTFGEGGRAFEEKQALIQYLMPQLNDQTTVLVKGSRVAKMEDVTHAITEH